MIAAPMEIRTLRKDEREAFLELVDGWELADGWRGRDFFRRYVEDDPTFEEENVFVAAEDGALLSCVQVFPRPLRMAGTAVPVGGIGSVFTRADARRRGLAEAILREVVPAMRERGLPVSLLFGEWKGYERLGWRKWPARTGVLSRGAEAPASPAPPGLAIAPLDGPRDLPEVRALHERYSELLPGTVARDEGLWRASLANAGNPSEEFLVARAGGELVAYARATVLYGFLHLLEFACAPGFEPALAALAARLMAPRSGDPFARPGRPSEALRRLALTIPLRGAPDLAVALAAAGIEARDVESPNTMLRCLDADALAARIGERPRPGEEPNDFLARLLPPEDAVFWPADRF
jgi:predicted N-acetyltransferase YhbS